jgi:hypothetical protein
MWLEGLLTDKARFKTKQRELTSERDRLLSAVERTDRSAEIIKNNARAVSKYVVFARARFLKCPPAQQRAIALMLTNTYLFFGRDKRIEIDIAPILQKIVSFAGSIQAIIEPKKTGSTKEKTGDLTPVFSFGGPHFEKLEPPDDLLELLSTESLVDLFPLEEL